jgi:hypothetical protein
MKMTEEEWLACEDPERMVKLVRGRSSNRKLRLFACACARLLWRWFEHPRCRDAVEVAERYADGAATQRERASACSAAKAVARQVTWQSPREWQAEAGRLHSLRAAACGVTHSNIEGSVVDVIRTTLSAYYFAAAEDARRSGLPLVDPERVREVNLRVLAALSRRLRDVVGNPFRPASLEAAWLTADVVALAQAAYEERRLPEGTLDATGLAVLADALEEAGCAEDAILGHLRRPGPHVRGCFVIDLLLGRE